MMHQPKHCSRETPVLSTPAIPSQFLLIPLKEAPAASRVTAHILSAMDDSFTDVEYFSGTWEDAAHALVDRTLPAVCERPTSLLALPMAVLSEGDCFRATLSLVLGFAIVFFAGMIKLPQIATIVNNKSVAGLSSTTFLVETFGLSYNLAAHYRQNYPLSTYGDFIVLILQNYVIMYFVYAYTKRPQTGIAVIASYFAFVIFMCSPYFPVEILRLMTLGNVAVVVLSRTPQAYANFVNGSTGALSIVTCWGIFLGACARIFTTLQDVDSFNILAGYVTSATLNGIIAFQVAYYRFVKPKSISKDKVKKST